MSANQSSTEGLRDGVDVVAIIQFIWRRRYIIGAGVLLFAVAAVVLALTAKEIYRGEVVVTEVQDNSLGGAAGLSGQLGGLAGLAGFNLGASRGDPRAQGVLSSRYLLEQFVRSQNLVAALTKDTGKRATLWFAVKRFQEQVVDVHEDTRKDQTSITVDWTDPVLAAQWANGLVSLANEIVRQKALAESTRNIAYLNKQITQTSSVEIQKALYNLIESETKTLMLANARKEYAFRVVDPAVVPEVRYSPKRTLMVLSGMVLGFLFGTLVAFALETYQGKKAIK